MNLEQDIEEIEERYNCTILMERDFGSRAWNLDHNNSDRDILAIFIRPIENYFKISENKDAYKTEINNRDYQIWDIRKLGYLSRKFNPLSIEFMQSDLHYYSYNQEIKNIFQDWEQELRNNFNPTSLFHHYASMSKKHYYKYLSDHIEIEEEKIEINGETDKYWKTEKGKIEKEKARKTSSEKTIKKYLMTIRATLYAEHILEKETIPNINFPQFIKNTDIIEHKEPIKYLIQKKKQSEDHKNPEKYREELNQFIETKIDKFERLEESVYAEMNKGNLDSKKIDEYLLRSLQALEE